MDDDFVKKRLERDMAELKRLCEDHFAKRREDDAKMEELKERIVTTKAVSPIIEFQSQKLNSSKIKFRDKINLNLRQGKRVSKIESLKN